MMRTHLVRTSSSIASSLTPVQQTSLLVAYWRMLETQRSSTGLFQNNPPPTPSLIQDKLAAVLIDKLASKELVQTFRSSPFLVIGINCLAIRTKVIDDWLLNEPQRLHAQQPQQLRRQVVNLGAGMCTRPYRLDWNEHSTTSSNTDTIVYEVDDAHLLEAKRNVLSQAGHEPRVPLVHVPGDVTNTKTLMKALFDCGYDPSLPTDWLGEGLFAYLPPQKHMAVFECAKRYSAPTTSRLLFTMCDPFCHDYVVNMMGVNMPWAVCDPFQM